MTSVESPTFVDQVFLNQAEFLTYNAEFLPGASTGLAQKLQKSITSNTPLTVKLGLDPTRPDLHLGHSIVLRKLKQFQELGHKIVLIIGDATALIGDPSGRNQTRPPLTEEEVQQNAQTYLDQAAIIMDVSQIEIKRNSEWLYKIDFPKLLELCSRVTVAQLLTRDDFSKRYNSQQPISLHELMYPIMQAYDSVAINADIELGGTDQRFNLLLGRDLQLAYGNNNPQSVLMMPLIEGTDGKNKMSKTYPEHCINLTDAPENMFGKLMSIPDEMIIRYMSLLTTSTPDYVKQCQQALDENKLNPRDLKADLAKCIIADIAGREAADAAEASFIRQFKDGAIPENIPSITLASDDTTPILDLMINHDLAPSKAEARRLIDGGGVRLNSEKVTDGNAKIEGNAGTEAILQVGKRKFLKIILA